MVQRYSPTSLETFDTCERKWWWSRQYTGTQLTKPLLAASIGRAIAAGMERFHKDELQGSTWNVEHYYQWTVDWFREMVEAERWEVSVAMESDFALSAERAGKAVGFIVGKQPLRKGWETVGAEMALPGWGNARIDHYVRTINGDYIVNDYKSKVTATNYQLDQAQASYRFSTQLYFYVAAMRSIGHQVNFFTISQVVIEPKTRLYLWEYDIDDRLLDTMLYAWEDLWRRMERVEKEQREPRMALTHRNQFGRCQFADVCLEGAGTESDLPYYGFRRKEFYHG